MKNGQSSIQGTSLDFETGYFLNDYEDAVIRFEELDGQNVWFLKFKGEKEFQVERSHRLVADAILENVTITKEEYDAF